MTKHEEDPASRWYTGVVCDNTNVFRDGVAGAKLREVEALPKPAPSQAVGSGLNVVPVSAGGMDDDERWLPVGPRVDAALSRVESVLREIRGRDGKPETIVQADDEQRAHLQRRIDKQHQHNRELVGSVARLEERLADATVRAYEPPDTLTGVAFAAVEGLVATGRRWWRR